MARFDISDFDKYAFDFNELANLPDSIIEEMLEAEGAIIRNAQSDSAKSMLQGPYYIYKRVRKRSSWRKELSTGAPIYLDSKRKSR